MHEKANQGLTLSIILLIPQPSKLPVGKVVSCYVPMVLSSVLMCKDIIVEMVFYNLPCTDAGRNHRVLHL